MSDLAYYNVQEKNWVSPRLILTYWQDLYDKFHELLLKSSKFQKVREARSVALQLLGQYADDGKHYYMQISREIYESPDIMTMFMEEPKDKELGNQIRLQDVEVVEYAENSLESLKEFLIDKKLSPSVAKQAYDDKTTILCHIKKPVYFVPRELHMEIKRIHSKPRVLIMGEIVHEKYGLTEVWPNIKNTLFNVRDQALAYPEPPSLSLTLGINSISLKGKSPSLPSIEEVFELSDI